MGCESSKCCDLRLSVDCGDARACPWITGLGEPWDITLGKSECKPSLLPKAGLDASASLAPSGSLQSTAPPRGAEKPLKPSATWIWEPPVVEWNLPEPGRDVVVPTPVLGVDAKANVP